jgi:tRNA(Ile)-lysidine synthase
LRRLDLPGARVVVALSGGLDSMVLLHLLHGIADDLSLRLSALHVDHGISPRSGEWAQFCALRCEALHIPLEVVQVEIARDTGSGLEAAARGARYAVFARQSADAVVLAHHLDDQAETVLLQLLRGAGAAGLAGMPQARRLPNSDLLLVRPLLDIGRAAIRDYAMHHALRWVEDESNAGREYDRNYVRHEILPRIGSRFPAYRETWLRTSRNLADLDELAGELARTDAASAGTNDGLRVAALRALSPVRRANLLRWFLRTQGVGAQPRERLQEALDQMLHAAADRAPAVRLGDVLLRRHRGLIRLVPDAPAARQWSVTWQGQPQLALPSGCGVLRFRRVQGAGLDAARLAAARVTVAPRNGGERIKPTAQRPGRSLKNLLREAGVPPWLRERLPLLFCDGALAWVPGIGVDCRLAARSDAAGVLPEWIPPSPAGEA